MRRLGKLCLLVFVLIISQTYGVIYRVNGTEYEQLPRITVLDDYEECMYHPEALYCTTELDLVSDTSSELFSFIRNYSERKLTHFNYSRLYRGICVTRTCNISKNTILLDRKNAIESCLNDTMWKEYKLYAKLTSSPMCYPTDEKMHTEIWDIIIAALCLSIIMLNIAATLYDINCPKKSENKGVDLFLAFSIPRNWSRLHQNDNRTKPKVERLKGIDGLRALMMSFIVMGHCMFPLAISVSNTRFIEEVYYNSIYHLLINGMYVVQYFFIMSACLLSYNMERTAGKKKIKWTTIPSYIFKRWLRLTPTYAICLAITSTWLRFMGSGPLWQAHEIKEINDCRRHWIWNLMYIFNYKDGSNCMPQAWYLAADMHLYCLGVVILVLVQDGYWRKIVLSGALIIGIITPAIPTYLYDLDTLLTLSPENLKNYAYNDPTFDYLYKRTHTNIGNYAIGLIIGIYLYQWQQSNFDIRKYKKFLVLYWASIPIGIAMIISGKVFFRDGPQVPLYLRVLFQMFARPIMAALFAALIIGMVFKFEDFYRGIFEWNGWAWIARISYSTYVTHSTVFRLFFGNSFHLFKISALTIVPILGLAVVSLTIAVVVWLILEAPVNQIVKLLFESSPKQIRNNDQYKKK